MRLIFSRELILISLNNLNLDAIFNIIVCEKVQVRQRLK